MESSSDNTRSLLYAALLHLGGIALLTFGLVFSKNAVQVSIPGPVIQAELVGAVQAPKPRAPKPAPPTPKPVEPKPEPPKPEPPKPATEEPARQDTVDRERIEEMALEKADSAKKAQEERKRQDKILLDEKKAEEVETKRVADEKKQKLEKERQAQLKDQEKKDRKLEQARLAELMEAEEAKTGKEGKDDSLLAQYAAAIQNAVVQSWLRPETAQAGLRCTLHIVQIPGGDVISVGVTNPCNADVLTRTSIEQAVKRAAPLPYKGFESEFRREIDLVFKYDQ